MRALLAAVALTALPLAAPAQTTGVATQPAATPSPAKSGDRIVCKSQTVSGSRIPMPKKCMTKRDWDSLAGRGKEDIDAVIRANLAVNRVAGG